MTAAIVLAGGASIATAQDPVLDELYGRGVHRFFAHDYVQAYDNFNLAIENGSQDPRVYYFRGLAASATGRPEEATSDWQLGARLEAQGAFGGEVGRALARIQGPTRLEIERIRQLARLQARSQQSARDRARYQSGGIGARPQPRVTPAPAPPTAPPPPASSVPPAPAPAPAIDARNNPFADDAGIVEGEPALEAEDALGGALEAAQPEPIAPEAAGTDNAPVAPEGTDTLDPGTSPFGDTGDDPFGDSPFGETTEDDPFGG